MKIEFTKSEVEFIKYLAEYCQEQFEEETNITDLASGVLQKIKDAETKERCRKVVNKLNKNKELVI